MKPAILNTLETCPVCGSSDFISYLESQDFFLSKETFQIVECKNCQFKFTNPRPLESDISKYYESIEYISHSNDSQISFSKIYSLVRNYTIHLKIKLIKKYFKSGNVLDIGSGTGEFLNHLRKFGFTTKGIEANQKARDFSITRHKLDVSDIGEYNFISSNSFDVITLWHVLEHIYNLQQQIFEIKRLLKNDGVLILALPNIKSYDAQHYSKYWAALDLPRHLSHFEKSTLDYLFKENGFELVEIIPMYFDSFYISILSEKYRSGKYHLFRAILIGLFSNFLAMFRNKNYSSLIYIFRLK